ncbi:MAG: lactate dehydrogenase [Gammaproteobacteria bacterium]|nr:lactate dehydrogenase [Gammaproteobacteria bacterium]
MKTLISTSSFGELDSKSLKLLDEYKIKYSLNPYKRKLSQDEIMSLLPGNEVLIAGTEELSREVLEKGTKLKLISRVGVGIDNIDLEYAAKKGIKVANTPSAPSSAVADLSLSFILSLIRHIPLSNIELHKGNWQRKVGRSLKELKIGIIGAGRIGLKLIKLLKSLGAEDFLIYDPYVDKENFKDPAIKMTEFDYLLNTSDVVSLHLPLTKNTHNLISKDELLKMKKDAFLINTSRGGIVNEKDLYNVLLTGHLAGVGIDVFEEEPYRGELTKINRALLTAHLGPMSKHSRLKMELEATEEVIRFLKGESLKNPIVEE